MNKKEILKKITKINRNDNWKKHSARIAQAIKTKLNDEELSIEMFADLLNVTDEKAENMLSGNYDFKLRELFEIEQKLNLNFLMI